MGLRVAELETLFTADVRDFETKATKVSKTTETLAKSDPVVKVGADNTKALAGLDRVTADAKKLTDKTVVAKVDADIVKAQANTAKIKTELTVLGSLKTDPTVTADITKAQASLGKAEQRLKALQGARAEMVVTADTSRAEADISGLGDEGSKAGKDAGEGLTAGIIGALVALPIAGTVVGIGAAIGKSLMDGIQVEVRSDRLMAQTGLDPKTVAVVARASGEAYANNFGGSLAENMDTARTAIQGGLLDPDGTEKDSQAIIESLSGVADILGEEIPRVSRSTTQLLRTGLAKDAAGAFDLIVKGTQAGLNVSEDMLDTIDEYGTQFRKLGLDGPQAFGLLSQAVKGGARDTDTAADALKEFSIRSVDMSKTSVAAFDFLGINAGKMADTMTKGGPKAAAALGQTLDKIRAIKDPSTRAAIAVALFGTKAEDMGDALYSMDLSTAVAELGSVEGAAASAVATLGDNTAGQIETARRNIETAADGIKGALASAFAPQIEGFSTFVTENRAAVMGFLLDMANGGINAGRALVNCAAAGIEGFGNLVGTVGPPMYTMIDNLITGLAQVMAWTGQEDAANEMVDGWNASTAGAMDMFARTKAGSKETADTLRENLITNGLDPAQAKLDAIALPMIVQAKLHDASAALAKDLDKIGYAADGSRLKLDTRNGTVKTGTASGKLLDEQIRKSVKSLDAEALAGANAGDSQKELNTRYEAGRAALIKQLVQMGYTGKQAETLANKYRAIPGKKETKAELKKAVAEQDIKTLQAKIKAIKQGKVPGIDANTKAGRDKIAAMQREIKALRGQTITVKVDFATAPFPGKKAPKVDSLHGGDPDHADGGYITGPGTGTSDSIPARLSNGEYVIRASSVAKIGLPALNRMNSFASGGLVGEARFADGGFVAADWSGIGSQMPSGSTSKADVTAIRLRQTKATQALHTAEAALHTLRSKKGHTTAQVNAAENKLTNARSSLRTVTASLHSAERSRTATARPLSAKVHDAATKTNAATGAFINNIDTLRKRGWVTLADQLLMSADDQAYALAAQAVKSSKVAGTLSRDVKTSVTRSTSLSARQDAVTNALQAKADAAAAAAEAAVATAAAARARAATLGDYTTAAAGGVANTTKFYANLSKLGARGFNALAARLLDQSDEAAEIVAEQAVAASDAVVSGLNSSITTATLQEQTRAALENQFAGVASTGSWATADAAGVAFGSAAGSATDMSGVRADLAEQNQVLRTLVPGFKTALADQARVIQTLQRQMAGAR